MSASRGLTVEITGLDELRRRLDPEIFGPAITAALTEAANLVKPEIERGAPRFSGRLARSVRITMDTRSGGSPKFARIAPRASHAIIVEKGSRPHWPPTDTESRGGRRFRRWVLRTLQPQVATREVGTRRATRTLRGSARQRAIDDLVFVVARSISKKGVKARPFVRPAFRATEGRVNAILERTAQELTARLNGGA